MQKITPFLWFDNQAEEAANFYVEAFTSVERPAEVGNILRYDEAGAKASGREVGSVMTIEFQLDGMRFVGLNGGPVFKFTPAVSFAVTCEKQEEIDGLWQKLSAVSEAEQCGWLQDKYGVSWQIVPRVLPEMLGDKDLKKAGRAMQAMLQMKKIDIKTLQEAYEG
ncbi:MAG: VOC family protein [Candidatus Sungbacteria bacterium]|nr:VOC family protein [Candidatus Sungbacteria bacterium]